MFKNQLETLSFVKNSAGIASLPGERVPFLSVRIPALVSELEDAGEDGNLAMRVLCTDMDFIETLDMEIVTGRGFSHEFGSDSSAAFILNEAAVRELELENPVGMDFQYTYNLPEPKSGKIIGIVKDFHYASLHHEVEPLMIQIFPLYFRHLMVKVNNENMQSNIAALREQWEEALPDLPFEYFFLDTRYDQIYKTELNLKTIVAAFTGLAIFVAVMGLLGLSSFITNQRRKEIAIRKVLGATYNLILLNISKEFIILVLISSLLAVYPAYHFMASWLQDFAFRIEITFLPFIMITLFVTTITLIVIIVSSYRTINLNPAEPLKNE